MKALFILLMLFGFTFSSCKKDGSGSPIDTRLVGKWEMISVMDNTTNTLITKPHSLSTNIDITITFILPANGNISGVLTTGTSVKGGFSIDHAKAIAIPAIIFYYPQFDIFYGSFIWDNLFSNNITISEKYSFDSTGNLNISCRNNTVMTFEKK